jgi:hypothetical protein
MAEWQNSGNGGMAYGMAYLMAYGMAGMAVRKEEWQNNGNGRRNGQMVEWRNGGMAYETVLCLPGIVQKGIVRIKSKGYEDELQSHFNSII